MLTPGVDESFPVLLRLLCTPVTASPIAMERPAAAATAAADYKRQVEAARKSIANLERQHDLRDDALAERAPVRRAAPGCRTDHPGQSLSKRAAIDQRPRPTIRSQLIDKT